MVRCVVVEGVVRCVVVDGVVRCVVVDGVVLLVRGIGVVLLVVKLKVCKTGLSCSQRYEPGVFTHLSFRRKY